jgi:hypothetical protein
MRALRPSLGLLLLLAAVAPGRGGPEAQVQPPKLTGPPEPPWKYRNEEAWIASEITRDIVEMVVYSKDRSLVDSGAITVAAQASPSSPAAPPSFDVSLALDPKAAPVRAVVVLDEHL